MTRMIEILDDQDDDYQIVFVKEGNSVVNTSELSNSLLVKYQDVNTSKNLQHHHLVLRNIIFF